jgi:hypothetical protein
MQRESFLAEDNITRLCKAKDLWLLVGENVIGQFGPPVDESEGQRSEAVCPGFGGSKRLRSKFPNPYSLP